MEKDKTPEKRTDSNNQILLSHSSESLIDALNNDSMTSDLDSIKNEESESCFPESVKQNENQMLVFGNASNSSVKEIKSALFEFGQNSPAVQEKELLEDVSGFDSADSTNDFDFNTHEAIQSAIDIVDKGLQDVNTKCFCNEKKINTNEVVKDHDMIEINIEKSLVCMINKDDSCNVEESSLDDKYVCDSAVEIKLSSVGSSNKEGLAISNTNEQKDYDQNYVTVVRKLNQTDESDCQESQKSSIGNNIVTTMFEHDVTNGRNDDFKINQSEDKTNEETNVEEDKLRRDDHSLSHENINRLKTNNSKVDRGSSTSFSLQIDNDSKYLIEDSKHEDINARTNEIESCHTNELEKNNDKEQDNVEVISEKQNSIQPTDDNSMDVTFEIQSNDGDHIENMIIDDECSEPDTRKITKELANITFSKDKNNCEELDIEMSNNSNKTIEIIKDSTNGSTLSVTLEDVEVSVFEGSTDKLTTLLKPRQKIIEEDLVAIDDLNVVHKEQKLDFSPPCLDEEVSEHSDVPTIRESINHDEIMDDSLLHQNEKEMPIESSKDTNLDIMSSTRNLDQKDLNHPVELQDSNIKSKSTFTKKTTNEFEKQTVSQTEDTIPKSETHSSQTTKNVGLLNENISNDSTHKILRNGDSITTDPSGENGIETVKVTAESTRIENIEPEVIADRESDQSLEDLETLIQSAVKKNEEFRKNIESDNTETINDENICSSNKEPDESEVICLVDDDDDCLNKKKKPAAAIKCVNPNCMSGKGLDKPAMFVLSYFGLKRTKDQQVCTECFNMVMEHQEKLAALLKERKPLFTADFPSHKDVILLDSDEESVSDNESLLSDDTMELIRENLDDVIAESLAKYSLDHQIRESCHILDNKIETMEEEVKELDKRFDQVQQTLDDFRKRIYEDFSHPIQEIEELHFTDCEIPPMPILRNKHQNQLYNRELMNSIRRSQQEADVISLAQLQSSPGSSRTIATKKVTYISQSPNQYESMTQDVIALHSELRCDPPPNLPPPGPLVRPKLNVGDMVYTMKVSYFSIWVASRIIEIIPRNPTENDPSTEAYRVRIESVKKNSLRLVTGKYIAYNKPATTQLKVGTRVIAIFREEDDILTDKENYYVGVVAEPPKSTNKFRYLVFFDDGYTQYCPHDNIRVVCNSCKNVWEDIHPEPRDFIRNYLQQYPERPMVKLSQGQVVRVEWNGRWWIVRVLEVDASLVKVHFDADKRTEWIYRGSTRLGPMFQELAAAKERQSGSLLRSRGFGAGLSHKSDMPYVEYTRGDGDDKKDEDKDEQEEDQQPVVPTRSVARKSTAKKPVESGYPTNQIISNPVLTKPLVNQVPQGKVSERNLKPLCKPRKFQPHQCNKSCVDWTNYNPSINKRYEPLIIPLMFGFARLNMTFRGRSIIMYRAPCGRTIRSAQEMLCYLQCTKSSLTIDLFDFDFWVNPLSVFEEEKTFCRIEDLSYGKENVPISCVNELDHSMPQYVQYMTARQPAKDVNLNLDPEFLVGCDCTDDCEDRSKCSCWQLTMQGKAYVPDGDLDPLFGYQYRRLPERIATGIYECNSKCKCSATCQNRVAQQPLSYRLQLFKTLKKGWGIRCLHDIPRGAFICIYAGFLLTETEANEGGKAYGDEYLAELDYIESVEGLKEGYESEARDMSDAEDDYEGVDGVMDIEYEQEQSIDSDRESSSSNKNQQEDIRLRLRRRIVEDSDRDSSRKSKQDDDSISISDDEVDPDDFYYTVTPFSDKVRKPQTFNANITESEEHESKYPSVRDLYGQDEQVYIMDAKTHGNIGRYLNHSCSPNVFVQNVFVDTHDLRFPWVAFFANQYVPAGTELTWDYNYDVGSVPGKVMLCYCGSPNCRGRLL